MIQKCLRVLEITVCLLLAVSTACSASQTITLSFANQNPETSWSAMKAIGPWSKQVEAATSGRVKIKIYYSQTLCKGKDIWNSTKFGTADMGWCFHGYWPGMTPLSDVIQLPALPFKTAEKGSEVLWKVYEKFPAIQKEFSDNQILLLYTSGPYVLITKDKPIIRMEDMKGLKIRMTGGPPTEMAIALGATPMLIAMPDVYIALQKGVLDGMGVPWEAVHGFRLYEVVNHYTDTPFPATLFSIAMNKRKWNSLPKDIQDAIMSVSGLEGSKFWGKNFFDTAKDAVMEKTREMGKELVFHPMPDDERQRWIETAGRPIWDNWVAAMEKQGHPQAREILDTVLELCK
jgi:TRAP-type C4-dicarboxylate transport system substrate-binding protein